MNNFDFVFGMLSTNQYILCSVGRNFYIEFNDNKLSESEMNNLTSFTNKFIELMTDKKVPCELINLINQYSIIILFESWFAWCDDIVTNDKRKYNNCDTMVYNSLLDDMKIK